MIRRVSIGASLFVVVSLFAVADVASQSGSSTPKPAAAQTSKPATPAASDEAPVIVVETDRGTFEFETYPKEAPKTVAHITALRSREGW